jgi:hypothetical protein
MQFVSGQPGSGQPRRPRVTDEMRRLVEENVAMAPALRTMMRGPTSVWERRVGSARIVLMWVDEGIQGVGVALDQFHGDSWYESNVSPHFDAFKALSESHPLE